MKNFALLIEEELTELFGLGAAGREAKRQERTRKLKAATSKVKSAIGSMKTDPAKKAQDREQRAKADAAVRDKIRARYKAQHKT